MLRWALIFLVVAIIAGTAAGIAQILFFIFLVLLVISVVVGATRGRWLAPAGHVGFSIDTFPLEEARRARSLFAFLI